MEASPVTRDFFKKRLLLIMALLAIGYVLVGARLVWLQVINRDDLQEKAQRQQSCGVSLLPRRGSIYDRNGQELAVSVDADSIYGVPASIKNPGDTARKLAPILGMSPAVLKDKLEGDSQFVWLARKVGPDLQGKVKALSLPAGEVGWRCECRRYYPNKTLSAHLLGFTDQEYKGVNGLEAQYEKEVGGVPGKAVRRLDSTGQNIIETDNGKYAPRVGSDLVLTIDEKVQYIVERELDVMMETYKPESAWAIVMDPRTGEILAMASRPGFNPNDLKGSDAEEWRNRAVMDVYEPGSTFKVITAAAALEENVVKPSDRIDCGNGTIVVGGKTIHNAHGEGGVLTFATVIQKSSNVGTIKVAERLGPTRLHDYAKAFGIGERTGIDLPNERPGMLTPVKGWSGVSIGSVAIGQEVGVTAIQMLSAINVIANGGEWVEPYIVKTVRSEDGQETIKTDTVRRRVISRKTASDLSEILCSVVEEGGTAVMAKIRGYQVAGKTGTAQKFDARTKRYSKTEFMSSFVGYVPADNPKLSAIVVVNNPSGAHYGGTVAGPVFKKIIEQTLMYMRVPTRLPEQTIVVDGK